MDKEFITADGKHFKKFGNTFKSRDGQHKLSEKQMGDYIKFTGGQVYTKGNVDKRFRDIATDIKPKW